MCQRQKANDTLLIHIRAAFAASNETYGMPRICAVPQGLAVLFTPPLQTQTKTKK
jgi:hypothetical protein